MSNAPHGPPAKKVPLFVWIGVGVALLVASVLLAGCVAMPFLVGFGFRTWDRAHEENEPAPNAPKLTGEAAPLKANPGVKAKEDARPPEK